MRRTAPERLERLRQLAVAGHPDDVVAARLGLPIEAVRRNRRAMGVVRPAAWKPEPFAFASP
jgi:hypothetical protein